MSNNSQNKLQSFQFAIHTGPLLALLFCHKNQVFVKAVKISPKATKMNTQRIFNVIILLQCKAFVRKLTYAKIYINIAETVVMF